MDFFSKSRRTGSSQFWMPDPPFDGWIPTFFLLSAPPASHVEMVPHQIPKPALLGTWRPSINSGCGVGELRPIASNSGG
jgi:hypothetical protein